jgi:hypothetical protein
VFHQLYGSASLRAPTASRKGRFELPLQPHALGFVCLPFFRRCFIPPPQVPGIQGGDRVDQLLRREVRARAPAICKRIPPGGDQPLSQCAHQRREQPAWCAIGTRQDEPDDAD